MKKRFPCVQILHQTVRTVVLLAFAAVSYAQGSAAGSRPTPPPEPAVKPIVSAPRELDKNQSKIDDRLESRAASARATLSRRTASAAEKTSAQQTLESTVTVEVIFDRQITQQQIDAFLKAGGKIEHLFQSVSYGWLGTIDLGRVENLPASLGNSLLGIVEPSKVQPTNLDQAGKNGRVRPAVWDDGMDGDTNITIAILDTGVDGAHADLSGRQQFWFDATGEGNLTAVDHSHHGTHVAGIAAGTGAASGSGATSVNFTTNGTFGAAGNFSPAVFRMPSGVSSFDWSSTLVWDTAGGGTAQLGHTRTDGAGNYAFVGSTSSGTGSPVSRTNLNLLNPNGSGTNLFSPYASWNPAGTGTRTFSARHSVSYNAGDGYNAMRGIAPGSRWAGYKVFKNDGSGNTSYIDTALDNLVTNRLLHNLKVANLSLGVNGTPGINTSTRNKVNTAAANGVVIVVAAGNDGRNTASAGAREVDDPGRAHYAITVGATSPINQMTNYSSTGFNAPGDLNSGDEDRKPDLVAPGGSDNQGLILAADSGTNDGSFADGVANDYTPMKGTSMAAPYIAGCAALVIDALQQSGESWDFTGLSGEPLADVMKVKQLLLMTASETNLARETGSASSNPTLDRGAKDQHEGYGLVNADAAVDAVRLSPLAGSTVEVAESADTTFGSGVTAKRVWARRVNLTAGKPVSLSVAVPGTGDFDAYLCAASPDLYGNPVILADSKNQTVDTDELISFTPGSTEIAYLVVKRVSGSGTFSINGTVPVSISEFAIY